MVLNVSPDGKWWLQLREGRREVAVAGGLDSKQAQAHIAKFMSAMAALAARGDKISDGYAIDTVVPPVSHAGDVRSSPTLHLQSERAARGGPRRTFCRFRVKH